MAIVYCFVWGVKLLYPVGIMANNTAQERCKIATSIIYLYKTKNIKISVFLFKLLILVMLSM